MADKSITARRGGDKGEGDFVNAPLSLTLSHEGRGDFLPLMGGIKGG